MYRLKLRTGSRVTKAKFATLDEALRALENRLVAASPAARRDTVDLRYREFEPVQQVSARGEVRGPQRFFPKLKAGVDLRGDGSAEAWIGGGTKQLVDQKRGETPYDALRRELL